MDANRGIEDESEIDALRSCVNNLAAIVSLPAIWPGEDSPQIITKLLEVLQRMLQLDFAYAWLPTAPGRDGLEIAKFASGEESNRTREIGTALLPRFGKTDGSNPASDVVVLRGLSITIFQLGLQDDAGWLAVASQRSDFPTKTEYLLLGVAANNTTLELEKSYVLRQQKQLAVELDRLVAQRTEELEKTNANLRKLQGELAHATRVTTLGELAASIAHEVNQPLTGIVTNSEASLRWLDREIPDLEQARKGMSRVIRDGRRAAEIIVRIRHLFRKGEFSKESINVNDLVRDVVILAKHEIEKVNVGFRFDAATGLPPALGDRVQLQQVLINLILNAIEAMNTVENRTRELSIHTFLTGDDRVGIEVRDNGPGIDPGRVAQIFDPFYTSKPSGMGMGLSICRSIVENHGSRLQLIANDTTGAAFQFTLAKSM